MVKVPLAVELREKFNITQDTNDEKRAEYLRQSIQAFSNHITYRASRKEVEFSVFFREPQFVTLGSLRIKYPIPPNKYVMPPDTKKAVVKFLREEGFYFEEWSEHIAINLAKLPSEAPSEIDLPPLKRLSETAKKFVKDNYNQRMTMEIDQDDINEVQKLFPNFPETAIRLFLEADDNGLLGINLHTMADTVDAMPDDYFLVYSDDDHLNFERYSNLGSLSDAIEKYHRKRVLHNCTRECIMLIHNKRLMDQFDGVIFEHESLLRNSDEV